MLRPGGRDSRLRIGPDRQSLRRSPKAHLRHHRVSRNRKHGGCHWYQSYLARACVELRQFDDAWHCIDEAMTAIEAIKERWCEAEINRIAGEIALKRAGCFLIASAK
jgi:hypothetical protein